MTGMNSFLRQFLTWVFYVYAFVLSGFLGVLESVRRRKRDRIAGRMIRVNPTAYSGNVQIAQRVKHEYGKTVAVPDTFSFLRHLEKCPKCRKTVEACLSGELNG